MKVNISGLCSQTYNYIFFCGQINVDPNFFLMLPFPSVCVCVYTHMHWSALEVAALALLRSTESARRSYGRLSGADS